MPLPTIPRPLRPFAAVGFCLLGGVILLPWKNNLNAELEEQHLRHAPVPLTGREALSQDIAVFALGGLRSLAVELLLLEAIRAWSAEDWTEMEHLYEQMTVLEPRRLKLWSDAADEMVNNAAGDAQRNRKLDAEERVKLTRYYINRGEQFLLKGIQNNPDSAYLYSKLGDLYSNRYRHPRFGKAVDAYKTAYDKLQHPNLKLKVFYNLSRIRGREKEAWEVGRSLVTEYPDQLYPSVSCILFVLQRELNIPEDQRFSIEQLFGSQKKAIDMLRRYQNNTHRFPTTGIKAYLETL